MIFISMYNDAATCWGINNTVVDGNEMDWTNMNGHKTACNSIQTQMKWPMNTKAYVAFVDSINPIFTDLKIILLD